jgi:hypothetical protein
VRRGSGGKRIADRERGEKRAEQVRAAALVLLLTRRAVLVGADRDVLGTVVGGQLAAAQRQRGRDERRQGRDRLPGRRRQRPRPARETGDPCAGDHRRQHAGTLERQPRLGKLPPDLGEQHEHLGELGGAAEQGALDVGRAEPLA